MTDPVCQHRLANGLTVLLQPVHRAPVTTLWVWYRVGSRNESTGTTGISHWVEHMLFKGTERYPKGSIDRLIAREGGILNGLTWLDFTCYLETLPADRIEQALSIEADRMVNSVFDPDEVECERTVVIAEREGAENTPLFQLAEEVQAAAIRAHPYHHEVIGWKSDLRNITRDDLWAHYQRHYHPANAIVVSVGAFEPDAMLALIDEHFGSLAPGEPPDPVTTTEPPQRGERRVTVHGADRTAYVTVAHRAPAAGHEDYFAFQVLDTVLGGAKSMNVFGGSPPNRSSRLYRALVDAELASNVSSGLSATLDPYLHTITAVVRQGSEPSSAESAIGEAIERMQREPLGQADMERATKQARAQFAYSSESVTNQGFWLGFAEIVADQSWRASYLDRLAAVTADDVVRVAQRWLDGRQRTVGHYVSDPDGSEP